MELIIKRVGAQSFSRIDLTRHPCPSIMADGIGGVCRRGWQYALVGCLTTALDGMVIPEGATAETHPVAFARSTAWTTK